jgi:hypothetical protein
VKSRKPRKDIALKLTSTFEPTRIARDCLAKAYELVVPTLRRKIHSELPIQHTNQTTNHKQLVGGKL